MTMSDAGNDARWGQPDPHYNEEFYRDIPVKRLIAWMIDAILISIVTSLVVVLTAFTAVFFVGFVVLLVSFLYRWWSLAARSATPGMRLTSMELMTLQGQRFDTGTAFAHTLGYTISVAVFPLQLISIVLMLVSARRQGLTDHVLGTVAINRRAKP